MRIVVVTPQVDQVATGNRCSTDQWAQVFQELGHEVEARGVGAEFRKAEFDLLVALNAKKIPGVIEAFKSANPNGRVVVVLTGTDIYPEAGELATASMRKADCLVALQSKAVDQIPVELQEKVSVIVQSATAVEKQGTADEFFDVAVVGHFREVKDPMRTAAAARLLQEESRVRVRQVGAVLDDRYEELIWREELENPRYQWLGELSPEKTRELIAGSDLLVLTSLSEGAGRVVGEAVVSGTPVLSSRIDGVMGLLGEGYSGYFSVGDTAELSELVWKAESDAEFYRELEEACAQVAPMFSPDAEKEGWRVLLEKLMQ